MLKKLFFVLTPQSIGKASIEAFMFSFLFTDETTLQSVKIPTMNVIIQDNFNPKHVMYSTMAGLILFAFIAFVWKMLRLNSIQSSTLQPDRSLEQITIDHVENLKYDNNRILNSVTIIANALNNYCNDKWSLSQLDEVSILNHLSMKQNAKLDLIHLTNEIEMLKYSGNSISNRSYLQIKHDVNLFLKQQLMIEPVY